MDAPLQMNRNGVQRLMVDDGLFDSAFAALINPNDLPNVTVSPRASSTVPSACSRSIAWEKTRP